MRFFLQVAQTPDPDMRYQTNESVKQTMKMKKIPLLGLGTYKLLGKECEKVVHLALELGYRHVDTADVYQNHVHVGRGVKSFPREEIFLATKIIDDELKPERVKPTVDRFLKELQVDYIDLLLIHWPSADVPLADTLKAMLALKDQGVVRDIGVSNFIRRHLHEIAPYHFPILTNQIELHPYLQRKALVEVCQSYGIDVTAYRPLAKGAFENDPVLQQIGRKHHKTPSQVVLRWLIQQGFSAIPKASSLQHLKENISVFDFVLDQEDIGEIDLLDAGKRTCMSDEFPDGD